MNPLLRGARVIGALCVVTVLLLGAHEDGSNRLLTYGAATAAFFTLRWRSKWAGPLGAALVVATLHPNGFAAGIGAGLLVTVLLEISYRIAFPAAR